MCLQQETLYDDLQWLTLGNPKGQLGPETRSWCVVQSNVAMDTKNYELHREEQFKSMY